MGIVNSTGFDSHGVPVERGVTVRTPHLGTPANLENHGATLGTRFRIFLEERDRLYVAGLARVFVIVFDLVTIRTNVVFANLALPPGRQEPSTRLYGTLANKHAFLLFGLRPGGSDCIARPMKRRYVYTYSHNLFVRLFYALVNLSNLENPRDGVLSLGEEAPLSLKQDRLAMLLELRVAENLGTGSVYNLPRPQLFTAHTVRVARHRQQVRLHTCSTRAEITKWTRDPFVI